jgi:hypothetical protein
MVLDISKLLSCSGGEAMEMPRIRGFAVVFRRGLCGDDSA